MNGMLLTEDNFNKVINGDKTQTRRIIKHQPKNPIASKHYPNQLVYEDIKHKNTRLTLQCFTKYARYKVGEIVYLKEPYYLSVDEVKLYYKYLSNNKWIEKWKNKLFMPEKYARYFIKIIDIKIEKLQDITEDDAELEGANPRFLDYNDKVHSQPRYRYGFYHLWNSIHKKKDTWNDNPFVFAYTLEIVKE